MSKSKIVTIDGQKLHFYVLGTGPDLILFHPSPSSAISLLPLAKQLSDTYTVYGIDTPGYGGSDSLAQEPTVLKEYTDFLHVAFLKLGLTQPAIYGSATGAQLAIRYGIDYPEYVSQLFLDNSAHFDDDLCNHILKSYFPDLTPSIDGSHLQTIWTMVKQMFQYFPWCFTSEEYALNIPQMPLLVLQMVAMDYLKAGKDYDVAYRLAFKHERGYFVQQLQVPTTIFRWNNSIIVPYIDKLLSFDFPEHIKPLAINGGASERTMQMVTFIKKSVEKTTRGQIAKNAIEDAIFNEIIYNKPMNTPPEILEDGSHLNIAWEQLVAVNKDISAAHIQKCLVDWFNTNS